MEPNGPEKEPGQAGAAAKGATQEVVKEVAKEVTKVVVKSAAKKAASSLLAAAMAHPMVAAIVVAVVLLLGILAFVAFVLVVGFLSGAVGGLYEGGADTPVCYSIPEGGEFDMDGHSAVGNYQDVVGVVDGYPTCVDPRLIYILSDIAGEGFGITESYGFGITAHHFWVGAFWGGPNRFSSVCPAEEVDDGCNESLHKQGRAIDMRGINGEVPNPTIPYYVGDTDPDEVIYPDVTIPGDTEVYEEDEEEEEEKIPRLSEPQKMVEWLTCDYAHSSPPFGFVLVFSELWMEDAADPDEEPEELEEGEIAPERFSPCEPPADGRFSFAWDGDHTKHVHLEVRCGPRWHRPAWDPERPWEAADWRRDFVVLRCGENIIEREIATVVQLVGERE